MALRVATLNAGTGTLKAAWAEVAAGEVRVRARAAVEARDRSADALLGECLARLGEMPEPLAAVVHRLVHGGDLFTAPVRLDATVEERLRSLVPLAPLHLPVALAVIRAARQRFPALPQIAVFDTAFHAGRAEESLLYALPRDVARAHGLRRYGFHGIAHLSLVESLAAELGLRPQQVDAVTLQLGAGCSACAVERGRSIETSMGFTPLEGLPMATRCGDVDAGVLLHLLRSGQDASSLEELLTRRSGLLGLSGFADVRDVLAAEARGDASAALALRLFARRIAMAVGAYWTLLGGQGALVFGGGIGAHSAEIRARIAAQLGAWGVVLDPERNARVAVGRISREDSRPVYAFATDEERILAREAGELLEGGERRGASEA